MTPGEGNSTLFMLLDRSAGIPPFTRPALGGLAALTSPPAPSILGTALFLVYIQGCVGIEKRLHFHGLGHTWASELLEEGLTVAEIRDWLCHTSLLATDKYLRKIAPLKGRQREW